MTIQTLSIEQMQHLQELGLDTSNASMCYYKKESWESCYFLIPSDTISEKGGLIYCYDYLSDKEYILSEVIPAYTLQDVLNLLPTEIKPNEQRFWLRIDLSDECLYYYYDDHNLVECRKKVIGYDGVDGLIDAAYSLLCWAIENGYVETNKTNEP